MYILWFIVPLGYILLMNINYTFLIIILIHGISLLFSNILISFYLFNSIYIYLSGLRILIFSIFIESSITLIILSLFNQYTTSQISIKDISIEQKYLWNVYYFGLYGTIIIILSIIVNSLKMPFEYGESESELVAGSVTEFSGIFFIVFSLLEINHTIYDNIILVIIILGGNVITIKLILGLLLIYLLPRVLTTRVKINNAHYFVLIILFSSNYIIYSWTNLIKVINYVI